MIMEQSLRKTAVLWWRYGYEHADEGVQVSPPYVISRRLDRRIAEVRTTPADDWRWWQEDEGLIVERADPTHAGFTPETRIFYLPERGLAVVKHIHRPELGETWMWSVHLANIFYDTSRDCWIVKALFCDILVDRACRHSRVLGLAALADALVVGLIDRTEVRELLYQVDGILEDITADAFPYEEVLRGQALCRQLGWDIG